MQVASADSCRMREIECVGTVELVCVGGLLRTSGESVLPVSRSVAGGFTGKGELDVWVVRAARKSPWDGSRMDWDGVQFYQECLPRPPSG